MHQTMWGEEEKEKNVKKLLNPKENNEDYSGNNFVPIIYKQTVIPT